MTVFKKKKKKKKKKKIIESVLAEPNSTAWNNNVLLSTQHLVFLKLIVCLT